MKILAFDLAVSGNTGWARRDLADSKHLASGILDLSLCETEHPGDRWPRIREELRRFFREFYPTLVVWERIVGNFKSAAAADLLPLQAAVVEVCREFRFETKTVNQATVKKFATGKGNCPKADVFAAAKFMWPDHAFASHDEADARFVLLWAENEIAAAQAGRAS